MLDKYAKYRFDVVKDKVYIDYSLLEAPKIQDWTIQLIVDGTARRHSEEKNSALAVPESLPAIKDFEGNVMVVLGNHTLNTAFKALFDEKQLTYTLKEIKGEKIDFLKFIKVPFIDIFKITPQGKIHSRLTETYWDTVATEIIITATNSPVLDFSNRRITVDNLGVKIEFIAEKKDKSWKQTFIEMECEVSTKVFGWITAGGKISVEIEKLTVSKFRLGEKNVLSLVLPDEALKYIINKVIELFRWTINWSLANLELPSAPIWGVLIDELKLFFNDDWINLDYKLKFDTPTFEDLRKKKLKNKK